ncbi:MAG: aminotransferase class V-fold PLP-dependent enzyme [Vicinamibacteraceae bacterium]|nr:aminotransferase class V-fold PLP-dependent enzyme [Vicinamibacteraceae bacterium]
MLTRRAFLQTSGTLGTAAAAALASGGLARVAAAAQAAGSRSAADLARDESFWREVQQAFTLDRTIINLNNGGCSPSPRVVHEAYKRYLDISNQSPVYHMWQVLEPNIEAVRRRLALHAGCDPEELAITRNTSESLQIAQLGLDLAPGDEIVTTNQDYGRMLNTWEQRVRRDKVVLRKVSFPVPPPSLDDLTARIEQAITPRTRVIHFCHITNLTGQIFPVRAIADVARARGIVTIVDGAHAFAHFPFALRDLGCDVYGTSLHKWLSAPIGTGFLYVRREMIPRIWPLTPATPDRDDNIRKFEEIGTHPAAGHNAIAEALVFHETIGVERKAARLRYLRERWSAPMRELPGVRMLTSDDPEMACGLGNVSIEGTDPGKLTAHLWERYRILATPIKHEEYQGVRVTPHVYTTLQDLDIFVGAMKEAIGAGIGKTATA